MLLEAGLTAGSRGMAPTLEAVYPSGDKQEAVRGKMASNDEHNRKYSGIAAEVPVISFNGTPCCKLPPTTTNGGGLTARMPGFRSIDRREVAPGGGVPGSGRGLLERPEPLYPSGPFKPRMPTHHVEQEAANMGAAPHRKSMFINDAHHHGARFHTQGPPHQGLPVRPPTSSSSSSPGEGNTEAAAAAAVAASAFFRRAFHPASIPGYPPGGQLPGRAPQPHPGLNPIHHHPAYAGMPSASAAGFMSLAHILFQPKYPLGKKTFTCHECRYITDRKNNLKRHIATMHQDCGKFLECCDTIFRSKAALRDHVMLYHRTGYKCRFCGRNFCRKALLKRHLTVHNGQKEFICEVCDYATSHKSNLERHRKVHGLGSPIGSDDEEHFLQDGPDGEMYRRFLQERNANSMDGTGRVMGGGNSSDIISGGRGEMFVDVETVHTDYGSDISTDDVTSNISDCRPSQDETIPPPAMERDQVTLRADPLLEAFPIGSASGKKAKGHLYLADRIRQTYDQHQAAELEDDVIDDIQTVPENLKVNSPKNNSKRCEDAYERRSHGDASGQLSMRPAANDRSDGNPSHHSPSEQTRFDGLLSREQRLSDLDAADARDVRKAERTLTNKGCKRLYASPYKCSECGLGLSSQRKLMEHALVCRKPGVDPPQPMKPLSVSAIKMDVTRLPLTSATSPNTSVIRHASNSDNPEDLSLPRQASPRYFHQLSKDNVQTHSGHEIRATTPPRNLKRGRFGDEDVEALQTASTGQEAGGWLGDLYRKSIAPAWRGDYSIRRLVGDAASIERHPADAADTRRVLGPASPSANEEDEPCMLLPIKKRSVNHFINSSRDSSC